MSKYYRLKVKDIVQETSDTITIHLKQPLFSKINYKPGQFLTLIVPVKGQSYRRAYSLSSSPDLDKNLCVTIKRVEKGIVSNFLNDHLKVGDRLDIMEPIGNFMLEIDPKMERHVGLFGAGSGVTPLMSIAKSVLANEPKSIVSLVYGNRTWDSIIFRELIEEMQAKYGKRFNVVHTLSQADTSWGGYKGRIDKTLVVNVLNLLPKMTNSEYFMCGPEGMMDDVTEALKMVGATKAQIHRESFVSAASSEGKKEDKNAMAKSEAQEIILLVSGDEYKLTVPPNTFILDAALGAGIDVPYSCQSGLCTACRGKCITGAVTMDEDEGLSEKEIKEGYVLTCVARPITNNVVIEIG